MYKTIAITGASGFIGAYLVQLLRTKGFRVKEWVRKKTGKEEESYYDMEDETTPSKKDWTGIDVLIHCAFIQQEKGKDAFSLNLNATQRLVTAARNAGVKKIIFFSTLSAHEAATSVYGKSKLAQEKLFDRETDAILKCGLVTGNGGLYNEMVQFALKKKIVPLIDGGRQPLQPIAIEKVAAAVEKIIHQNISGNFLLADPKWISYKDFFKQIEKEHHTRFRYIPVPAWVLRLAISVGNALHIPLPVNKENLAGLISLREFDTVMEIPDQQ